ncbi:MAG: PH domain-containing protein [Candidatus Aminicenantes bacterium]|nr:PH domain-containing protein [Candidatus Aminicenantes bacterium]
MDMLVYETGVRYEGWVKFFLGLPVVLMAGAGLVLSGTVRIPGLDPSVLGEEARLVSWVFFAGAAFILLVYWLTLPTRIAIHADRIRIRFGRFFYWTVGFETIESAAAAKGIPPAGVRSSVTSYRNQIEIARRGGARIRISPENRDEFLARLSLALEDWKRRRDEAMDRRQSRHRHKWKALIERGGREA